MATPVEWLHVRNAHARDERLAFDGPSHTYVADGVVACRSVTSVVGGAFPAFEPQAALATMKRGARWRAGTHPMYGKDDAAIVAEWNAKGTEAAAAGTAMHLLIERLLNVPALDASTAEFPEVASGFPAFQANAHAQGWKIFRTEWPLFDKRARLAGTVDAVFVNAAGQAWICDWKRTPAIPFDSPYQTALPPLAHLPDCKGVRYSLQLNLYRHMLETQYDMAVAKMTIVAFHTTLPFPHFWAHDVDRDEHSTAALCDPAGSQ